MGETVSLRAKDGHELSAYVVQSGQTANAGLVIVQEVFGVNAHIRSVTDRYADENFVTIAPALFDRLERGLDLKYEGPDMQRAMELAGRFNIETGVDDIAAAVEYLRGFGCKKVGVVGYCLGGTLAWLSAARLPIDAAVGYYGGHIEKFLAERPKAPVELHFGDLDQHIPAETVDAIAKAYPDIPIYRYPAGHGFNCDARASYDASSATLARERTLKFLRAHLE